MSRPRGRESLVESASLHEATACTFKHKGMLKNGTINATVIIINVLYDVPESEQ